MIRSIFVKGLEAITFECVLAAQKAGVTEEIFRSLQNTLRFDNARQLADYVMQRVALHGRRRAVEMRESATTLAEIGVGNDLATATARLQEAIGNLDLKQHFDDVVPQNATEIAKMVLAVTQDRSSPEASDTDPQV